jgi:hypothetical protein
LERVSDRRGSVPGCDDRRRSLAAAVNEVPAEFPVVVLWRFRVASAGSQLIMWTTIGLLIGVLAERVVPAPRGVVRYSADGSPRRRRELS